MLSTAMSSCINESDAGCVQYAAKPYLVGSDGTVNSDTAVKSITAYLFSEGKFSHEIKAESDSRFLVSFDGTKNTSLVMIGYPGNDSLSVNTPKEGDDISEVSSAVLKTRGNLSPEGFYYGRYDYTPKPDDPVEKVVNVSLQAERATVKVVVENLKKIYGANGNYRIELSGLRSAVSFGGESTGDSVSYRLKSSFDDGKDNLCSETVSTLPTKEGESVTVSVYDADRIVMRLSNDVEGKAIKLLCGEGKTIILNVETSTAFTGSTINGWEEEPGHGLTAE
jgi:hypothetical protein